MYIIYINLVTVGQTLDRYTKHFNGSPVIYMALHKMLGYSAYSVLCVPYACVSVNFMGLYGENRD